MMQNTEWWLNLGRLTAAVFLVGLVGAAAPGWTQTTTTGSNAVFTTTAPACCNYSNAVIDASKQSGNDICVQVYNALAAGATSASSVVVDARGVVTSFTCGSNETPWRNGSNTYQNVPATILLPAGTIALSNGNPWILPNGSKLIGQGVGQTKIVAATSSFGSQAMIQMGTATGTLACPAAGCTGVSIEDLSVDATNGSNGISNLNSGEGSYVRRVNLSNVHSTGLLVSTASAKGSGPYSDITFNLTGTSSGSTICIKILNVGGTKGFRGISCQGPDSYSNNGIELDSSNETIEDVVINGFSYGIHIGVAGAAQSDVVFNVSDITSGSLYNATVAIEKTYTVTDVVLMGIHNENTSGAQGHLNTIVDQWSSDSGSPLNITDAMVGLYVIGQPLYGVGAAGPFSRFTTSVASVPTWVVGSTVPGSGTCTAGSLYSNTGASGTNSYGLYACAIGSSPTWKSVK